jgi:Cu-Zn family superoxide dismutase
MDRRLFVLGSSASGLAAAVGFPNLVRRATAQSATPVADMASPVAGATVFELPGDEVYPEGVAYDPSTNLFYVGSTTNGALFQGDLASGEVTVLSENDPDRTTATGMKIDGAGHLIVAGASTGSVFVVDAASGQGLASFSNGLESEATFVNDVAVAPNGDVYATDSLSPFLYRIVAADIEAGGELVPFVDFTGTVYEYTPGAFNANGIAITDDGAYAIMVNPSNGRLFRIDLAGAEVTEITINGESVTFGDGILLDGSILFVCRNQLALIVRLELDAAIETATTLDAFTDPSLMFPTTIAQVGEQLLVVNAQFDRRETGDPVLPFTVSLIDIPPIATAATPVAEPVTPEDDGEEATPVS